MSSWQAEFLSPKLLIALVVLGMFGWALSVDPNDATMKGALIAGFAGAWGFYLGSSNNSSKATENTGKAFEAITATAQASGGTGAAAQAAGQVADAAVEEAAGIKGDQ
jgi:hypothetical protein